MKSTLCYTCIRKLCRIPYFDAPIYLRMRALIALAFCVSLVGANAQAVGIDVIGLFPGKAVLVVNGGSPKTYSVGTTVVEGVKLLSVNESSATIEANGKRQTIPIGPHQNGSAPAAGISVTLQANGQGHYVAQGQINGGAMRMLVDTGATMVALSASDATRIGINYKKGRLGYVNTANGPAPVYRVSLSTVKIGDIELNQVDAVVQESGLPFALLGMSFLSRTEMRNDGQQLTLTKRF
jgi:aspartyl protease family protein